MSSDDGKISGIIDFGLMIKIEKEIIDNKDIWSVSLSHAKRGHI